MIFSWRWARVITWFPAVLWLALTGWGGEALAQGGLSVLTQADIDGYVYLTPRLSGSAARDPETAARLLAEAGLSRRRAGYVGAKIAVAQAMITGALSPEQLDRENVPLYLHPTAEELSLVQKNLTSLTQAQIETSLENRRPAAENGPGGSRVR